MKTHGSPDIDVFKATVIEYLPNHDLHFAVATLAIKNEVRVLELKRQLALPINCGVVLWFRFLLGGAQRRPAARVCDVVQPCTLWLNDHSPGHGDIAAPD